MQPSDGEIYGPFGLSLIPTIISILIVVLVFAAVYAYLKIRTKLALKRQAELARVLKPNIDQIIANALARIEQIRQAVFAGQHNIHQAAADVSLITRQTFDSLMNHKTAYLSHHEIELKNLERVSATLTLSYPVEFSSSEHGFNELCNKAAEVIGACR